MVCLCCLNTFTRTIVLVVEPRVVELFVVELLLLFVIVEEEDEVELEEVVCCTMTS